MPSSNWDSLATYRRGEHINCIFLTFHTTSIENILFIHLYIHHYEFSKGKNIYIVAFHHPKLHLLGAHRGSIRSIAQKSTWTSTAASSVWDLSIRLDLSVQVPSARLPSAAVHALTQSDNKHLALGFIVFYRQTHRSC